MINKTILITGASSGIGLVTAQHFYNLGWNVVATMRKPAEFKDKSISEDRFLVLELDVTKKETIKLAVNSAINKFGKIDVWVNNAGYGASGPIEAGTDEQIRQQFDVNFFGLIDCTKEIIPHFKKNKDGVIINISSIGGLMTLPTWSLYNSSKFAVEGLSEGLVYELAPFNIKVKLIEPGAFKTDFMGRSMDKWDISNFPEYADFMQKFTETMEKRSNEKAFADPILVAQKIEEAVLDNSDRLRYPVGKDAKAFIALRRLFGSRIQMRFLRKFFGLKKAF